MDDFRTLKFAAIGYSRLDLRPRSEKVEERRREHERRRELAELLDRLIPSRKRDEGPTHG